VTTRGAEPARPADAVARDLRLHAVKMLPPQLVPYGPVVLSELPLTVNGKVDRNALAEHGSAGGAPVRPGAATAAATAGGAELEDLLGRLFERFAITGAVGRDESFFAAGGTSVNAMKLLAEVNRELGVHVKLRSLAEAPTVRLLARHIEAMR
jgi:aryl carrier-like protein